MWFNSLTDSVHITISPNNQHFSLLNDKIILKKADENSDNFDVLLYACRDIENANIPDYVRIISPFAFHNCQRLITVRFSKNSQLQVIGENAFANSSIMAITFPCHLTQIKENAFNNCIKLESVVFNEDSEIRSIPGNIFKGCCIKQFIFPKNLEKLEKGWEDGLDKDVRIINISKHFRFLPCEMFVGKSDISNNNFDIIYYAKKEGFIVEVPDNITQIGPFAFANNEYFYELTGCLNLRVIGSNAFQLTSISKLTVPSSLKIIGENAFYNCIQLLYVEFAPNSQLEIIGNGAFESSKIRTIKIPPSVIKINKRAFCKCENLYLIEFEAHSNLKLIGTAAFMGSHVCSISIPSSVIEIESCAFADCIKFDSIEFPDDSQLKKAASDIFYSTTVKNARITSKLSSIIKISI